MSSPSHPTHRIAGQAELLDAIPYLLGFHPTESLVLVGLHGGMLGVSARLDLADTGQPDLVDDTVAALHRGGADRLVVAVFDDDCEPPAPPVDGTLRGTGRPAQDRPWAQAVLAVDEAAERVGARLTEALLVRRGRWWSYLCAAQRCCPAGGNLLTTSPSPFAAAATVEGIVALPDRAALAATLEPLPGAQRAVLDPLIGAAEHAAALALGAGRLPEHERSVVREVLLAARSSDAAGWQPPDDATAARLGAALATIAVRDQVWMAIDARRVDGRPLWTSLARRCPSPYDAAPSFLLGWSLWRAGNGVLAGMALERALDSDPSYSAADLLLAALGHAIDPRTFPPLTEAGFPGGFRAPRRRARRGGAARTPR